MLWLYDEFEKDFKYNGIVLNNAYDSDIHWVLNTSYKLTFKYPTVDNEMYSLIEKGMVVKADEHDRTNLFRIKDIDINENDKCITVTAYHFLYDFNKRLVNNFSRVDVFCQTMLEGWYANFVSSEKDFSYYSDIFKSNSFTTFKDEKDNEMKNSFEVLGAIANVYSADIDMHDKQISLLTKLGRDTEEVLTTAKNINEFVNTSNSDEIVTRIYASTTFKVGDKEDKNELKERHRRELASLRDSQKRYSEIRNSEKRREQIQNEINKKYAQELAKQNKSIRRSGKIYKTYEQISSEVNSKYQARLAKAEQRKAESQSIANRKKAEIEALKARQKDELANLDDEVTIKLVVESPLIDDYPFINEISISNNELRTAEELEEWATKQFTENNIDKPKNSIKVSYEQLSENINRGDTVILKYLKYNIDERIRIVETHYDPMLKKWKEFILGEKEGRLGTEVSNSVSSGEFRSNIYTDRIFGDIQRKVREENENFNKIFEKKTDELKQNIDDGIERAKASSEEFKASVATNIETKLSTIRTEVNADLEKFKNTFNPLDTDEIERIRREIDEVSQVANTTLKMVGTDDSITYNKNRVEGATEREIALGTDFVEVRHNGDGFEVGKPYTISWESTCRQHDFSDVNVRFNKPLAFPMTVGMIHRQHLYPNVIKEFAKGESEGTLLHVYNGEYAYQAISDWYKTEAHFRTIDGTSTIHVNLHFKEFADVGDDNNYIGEWSEDAEYIFDGGN